MVWERAECGEGGGFPFFFLVFCFFPTFCIFNNIHNGYQP